MSGRRRTGAWYWYHRCFFGVAAAVNKIGGIGKRIATFFVCLVGDFFTDSDPMVNHHHRKTSIWGWGEYFFIFLSKASLEAKSKVHGMSYVMFKGGSGGFC